jgi:predicted ABC-type ATPase
MPSAAPDAPVIFVLAGVNGAGKSSTAGALIRDAGLDYFNPDEAAKRIRRSLGVAPDEANALAWKEGKQRLEAAIRGRFSHAFESTLGGRTTIPALLLEAADGGIDVLVWYLGLATPELHIARVRARVAAGGHPIPEALIRERWDRSRRNILKLMPHLAELRVFDNSDEGDPAAGSIPPPRLLLHWARGGILGPDKEVLTNTPDWAKAIVAGAMRLQRGTAG